MARNHSVLEWGLTQDKKIGMKSSVKIYFTKNVKTNFWRQIDIFRHFYQNHVHLDLSVRYASFSSFHLYYNQILTLKYQKYKQMKKKSKKIKIIIIIFALPTAKSAKLTSLVQYRFIKNVVNDFYVTWLHVKSIPDANMLWNRPGRSTVNLAGLSRDLSKQWNLIYAYLRILSSQNFNKVPCSLE